MIVIDLSLSLSLSLSLIQHGILNKIKQIKLVVSPISYPVLRGIIYISAPTFPGELFHVEVDMN